MKNPAAVTLGRLGGKAGTGDAKRRSPEHYAKLAKAGVLARKRKAKKRLDRKRLP